MKYFKNEVDFRFWFNRYFNDEIAYVKTLTQEVVFVTKDAIMTLGIKLRANLLEQPAFIAIKKQIINVDNLLVKNTEDAVVMETLLLNGSLKVFCWNKKLVMIDNQLHILVEQTVTGELSVKKLFGNQFKQSRNLARHQIRFRDQELCIMYLMANNFTIEKIAETLFIAPATVRAHLYNKIVKKLNALGYEVYGRLDTVELLEQLGYGKTMPNKLLQLVKPTASILNIRG